MGSSTRCLAFAALIALLVPSVASAQGTGAVPTTPPAAADTAPPPGGGSGSGGSAGAGTGAAAEKPPASAGNVGGVSFQDKPVRRAPRAVLHRSGPLATFPGFEQLPDGGTRLFVQLSQSVPIEERRAQGSITYVMKGAHLRVHNDANALVTVHFNTPVFRARLAPSGNDLLFILEMRAAATPTFKLTDNPDHTATLQIDFAKGDFLNGDAGDSLPPEAKPNRALGRVGKGAKGQQRLKNQGGAAPAAPDTQAPASGDPGPNP
jgi:hypothetical protein